MELLLYFAYVKNSWSWGYPEMFSLDICTNKHDLEFTNIRKLSHGRCMRCLCSGTCRWPWFQCVEVNHLRGLRKHPWESEDNQNIYVTFHQIPLIPKLWYSNPSHHQAQTSTRKKISQDHQPLRLVATSQHGVSNAQMVKTGQGLEHSYLMSFNNKTHREAWPHPKLRFFVFHPTT